MSRQSQHGRWRKQPAVNKGVPGTVSQAYSWLFPPQWRAINDALVAFDSHWFLSHPGVTEFWREYVPGEAYPKHDSRIRYVCVMRSGATRVRVCAETLPADARLVEIPDGIIP